MFDITTQLQEAKELYSNGSIDSSVNKYIEILGTLKQKSTRIVTFPDIRQQVSEIDQIIKDLTQLQSAYDSLRQYIDSLAKKISNFSLHANISGKIARLVKDTKVFTAQSREKLGDSYFQLCTDNSIEGTTDHITANTHYIIARDLYNALFMLEEANRVNNKMGLANNNNKSSKRKSDEMGTFGDILAVIDMFEENVSPIEGTTFKKLKIEPMLDSDHRTKINFNSELECRTYIVPEPYQEGEVIPETKAEPVSLGFAGKSKLKVKLSENEISHANENNNNVAATVSSSKLLPLFVKAFEDLSERKSDLSHALIGGLLRIIGHYHLQFLLDETVNDMSEPFPSNLFFSFSPQKNHRNSEQTARNVLAGSPVLNIGLDCLYIAATVYRNEIALNELLKYKQVTFNKMKRGIFKSQTLFQKYRCNYDFKPREINASLEVSALLIDEIQKYCTELEAFLGKYPELLDQFLLRLCAFIADSFSVASVSQRHEKDVRNPIEKTFASIFDSAREKMEDEVPIELDEEPILTSESENGSDASSSEPFSPSLQC